MSHADWIEHYRYAKVATDSIVHPKTGMREARRIATSIIGEPAVQAIEAVSDTLTERKAALAHEVGSVLTQRAADARRRPKSGAVFAPAPDRSAAPPPAPADDFVLTA